MYFTLDEPLGNMAAFNIGGGVPAVYVTGSQDDIDLLNDENSQLLADAIKRMDGLIGDYSYMYVYIRVCEQNLKPLAI